MSKLSPVELKVLAMELVAAMPNSPEIQSENETAVISLNKPESIWIDTEWKKACGKDGATYIAQNMERAMHAASTVAGILMNDELNQDSARDNAGVSYQKLGAGNREGLRFALDCLHKSMLHDVERLRDRLIESR